MFLKSVTLRGFKSFSETTRVDFDSGMNVVVGPNGTGKSNIVEAIAWVLGSQSPNSLRSDQMADVIFAGSPGRPALGRAEVVLTLCNEDGRLPVDFPEVSISRSLFRSGESAYAINGTPARLVDITEMLAAGGVGRHRHVIVSQGRIDAMLFAKPTERRAILEEAAGVSAYRLRKEKSLRRLSAAEANLTRLVDQLREVRRQLKPLEEQAEAARRYGELASELENLRIYSLSKEIERLNSQRLTAGSRRRDLADVRSARRREIAYLEELIGGVESQLGESSGAELSVSLERFGRLASLVVDVGRALTERRHLLERRLQSLLSNDVYVTLESESEQIRASICAEEAFAGDVASRREALAAATEQLNKRRADLNRRLVAASGESDARSLEGRLALRRAALSSALAESSALARQSNLFQTQREQAQDELSCLRAEIAEHAKRLEEAAAARRVAEGRNEEALAAVPEAVGLLGEARTELALWESRVEVLEAAAKTAGGRPPAELTASLEGFLGTVNELLEPEEGWEKAYAAALGGLAEALVMEGPESSLLALEALRHWRSEAVLLPLGVNADSPPPSIGEPLTAHVRVVAERAEKLPENLLSGVLVVDDHKDALAGLKVFPQGVFVTRRGDCFTVRGWKPGVEEIARAAADVPEIDAPDALEAARARLAEAESAHAEALSEASAASAVLLKADEAYREAERLISTSRERASLLDGRLTTLQPAAESAEKRLKSSRSAGAQLRVEVDDLEGRLSESKVREEAARSQADAEEESLASEDKRNAEAARALDLASAESAARERIFRKRLEEIETRLQAHRSSVDTASNSALSDKIASLEKMSGLLSERESELRLLLERLRSQHTRLGELTRARFASLDFLRAKRNRLVAQAEDLAGAFLEAERVETELSVRREALVETLHSRHGCDPVSGMAATSLPEGVSVSTRVKELEKLLGRIGLINPLAEREYELLSARYEFLTSQVDDVRRSKRDLNKVIRAIDSDIVQVFSKFYEQVSASFESCFLTLFEGGAGRLRLTDPANPLESGVEIEARPGGKYLRKLTLLSGGERSLTALALVFALLRSQNSPFFVLDEVDAALDDVNLQRFLRLTREFRSEVQLLMVSHQKRTMEIADCLLGVSMKSGSGSRVISERPSAKAVVSEPPLLAHAER